MKPRKYRFDNFKYTPFEIDQLIVTSFILNTGIVIDGYLKKYVLSSNDPLFEDAASLGCMDIEDVIHYFEIAVPIGESTTNGAVYTPSMIRNRIVNRCIDEWVLKNTMDLSTLTCADLSCGCGAFLYTFILKIMKMTNCSFRLACHQVYGIDINPDSIERTKILLSLAASEMGEILDVGDFNLEVRNSLSINVDEYLFDIVVGNPPYVRSKNIGEKSKTLLQRWAVSKDGNSDLYIPFFEIGLSCLNENGVLGYITPNTFLTSVNGRSLRTFLSSNKYSITIENFRDEKVFEGKMVYTCLTYINKDSSKSVRYIQVKQENLDSIKINDYSQIDFSCLDNRNGWFLGQGDTYKNVLKIRSCGKALGDIYPIKNGIATLANDIFIFKPTGETELYYLYDEYKIEKAICRNIIKPNKLKKESEIPILMEKVIFPYDQNIQLYEESYFKTHFPESYNYLYSKLDILMKRDKGKCDYQWYAFGRTQAIRDKGIKLLFPYMSDAPHFVFTDDNEMLIYCGYAIYSDSSRELLILKKLLESEVFNYYMKNTSKPYSAGFYSYAKNYVKDFGLCELSEKEKEFVEHETNKKRLDEFFIKKYNLSNINI